MSPTSWRILWTSVLSYLFGAIAVGIGKWYWGIGIGVLLGLLLLYIWRDYE